MTTKSRSTRRSFIRKTGAALSVPLAAVAATVPASAVTDGDPLTARLAMLEDVNAIRSSSSARLSIKSCNQSVRSSAAVWRDRHQGRVASGSAGHRG